MADKTGIEWTDATWNPIAGCSIVSPGCTNCYAMRMAGRIEAMGGAAHYAGTTKPSKAGPVWTGKVAVAPDHILTAPLRWKRPRRIFVNSMSDLFHPDVPDAVIDRVFAVMALAPRHTFQVLTKRPVRMRSYLSAARAHPVGLAAMEQTLLCMASNLRSQIGAGVKLKGDIVHLSVWPLPNVWLGVSVEDQKRADERIPDLLATPAAIRFVSAEPLLGPIDFERIGTQDSIRAAMPGVIQREERGRPKSGSGAICGAQIDAIGPSGSSITFFQTPDHMGGFSATSPRQWPCLDWIIVGGESGPDARPMHPDWVRSLRDQCAGASVPFLFKQWGSSAIVYDRDVDDPDWRHCDKIKCKTPKGRWLNLEGGTGFHGERVVRVNPASKKRAGRLLDGALHDAYPEVRHG